MSIISRLIKVQDKHHITLWEGESFKQALYNNKLSETADIIIDKIELAIKHYPEVKEFSLNIYDSDSGSPREFHYTVVIPVID